MDNPPRPRVVEVEPDRARKPSDLRAALLTAQAALAECLRLVPREPKPEQVERIAVARETERFFVDVAKERLSEAQFRELFEEARRRWAAGDDGKR